MRIVLKIGGNEIDNPTFLGKASSLVAGLRKDGHQIVLVHGGGKEISTLLDTLGIATRFVDGMRYTDTESLKIIEMMLSGAINKRLVRSLQSSGVRALGVSGVDAGILVADKLVRGPEDVGLVGEVSYVDVEVVEELTRKFVLVLSPVSADKQSAGSLNVNADYAAAAVASFLRSELIIFLSNVPGVISAGNVLKKLQEREFEDLKKNGVITGGMVPKIEAAFRALKGGAGIAFITDAEGAEKIASGGSAGTQVTV